ncbi:hypothetical protein [Streptacidiphilus sp. EB129]|uniref:hypothetical protein n=1 Tax=Streptacidiphilus sp. EB129 TaxID=3156262 RepID=UPI003519890F
MRTLPGPLGRPSVRPLLEVALLHGLLGWLYVAAVAATRPDAMAVPIASVLPMRRDTFGACCFAVSGLAAFALQAGEQAFRRRPVRRGAVDAALRTVVGYALLVWAYLCVNSLTHPGTTARQLTHFATVPTEGTAAVGCFAASAVALYLLRSRGARRAAAGTDG